MGTIAVLIILIVALALVVWSTRKWHERDMREDEEYRRMRRDKPPEPPE